MRLLIRPLTAVAVGTVLATTAAPVASAAPEPATPPATSAGPEAPAPPAASAAETAPAASGAPAARAVSMVLNASATTVSRGATVRFSGRVWRAQTGNQAPVYFYFRKRGTATWSPAGSVRANSRGNYVKLVRATTTGTWKAVYRGGAERAPATRGRVVNVLGTVPRQIAAYHAPAHAWQSPRLRIPTKQYRAVATYRCPGSGWLYLTWNGDDNAYESVSWSKASGTVTLNGHQGARSGYFDVATWMDCTWSLKVYSGTVRVLV